MYFVHISLVFSCWVTFCTLSHDLTHFRVCLFYNSKINNTAKINFDVWGLQKLFVPHNLYLLYGSKVSIVLCSPININTLRSTEINVCIIILWIYMYFLIQYIGSVYKEFSHDITTKSWPSCGVQHRKIIVFIRSCSTIRFESWNDVFA